MSHYPSPLQPLIVSLLLLLALSCQPTATDSGELPAHEGTHPLLDPALAPFYHGVASGDPLPDAVIIWTRLTTAQAISYPVRWEVATDSLFTQIVREGTVETGPGRDYTVKVDVDGLSPGSSYFYRFGYEGKYSLTGQTRTAPEEANAPLQFAVISCSNYEAGFFNTYARLADRQNLAGIIHLGDYIYEYGPGTYGDSTSGRFHLPPYEIISLSDYRTRYAQYRLDPDLRHAHQRHPFIAIWDDHEIANNAYREGAQNHQPEEGDYRQRKADARQAYYEWLPVREESSGQLYRYLPFGKLADLFMLDERLEGRVAPVESTGADNYASAERRMLGEAQFNWLAEGLQNSEATWKLIGNQVIFSPLNLGGMWGSQVNLDAWDGYPYERSQLLQALVDDEIGNVLFLTGDTHSSWAFEVPADMAQYAAGPRRQVVAVELGTTSVSSANTDEGLPRDSTIALENMLQDPARNPHLKYVNLRDHGYLLLTLSPEAAEAEWYYVDQVVRPSDKESLGRRLYIEAGAARLLER